MSFRIFVPIILAFLLFTAPAQAFDGLVQAFGADGTIAWGSGDLAVVRSIEGAATDESDAALSPLSVRKAVVQARKRLLDMVLSVRIDGHQTVGAFLSGDSDLAAQVRGLIQNSLYRGPGLYDAAGTVRVSEQLRGQLAELILPNTVQFQSGIPPRLSTATGQGVMDMPDNAPEEVGSGTRGYTGVIVDARGLKLTPALAPVIYGQDGFGAYGYFQVGRTNVADKGMVAYAVDDNPKVLAERVGNRPLMVKALSAYGSWRTDVVIAASDARLVRAVVKTGSIADGCKVVILVDAPEKSPENAGAARKAEGEGDA
ncbi:hypothetical protein BerOc1_03554 [Pseudodesulfovibrio hydrargyri]|uniref:Uncharacterized protein n=1 Tax=Pseudodesulfovibrio hydrargyri TaxID=2125990 RepID=A0A1J5NAM1_9BACT|nr:hypothetical protein [Pseudodesulfovibrio hydrargyri]OIQ48801.1 hypothetical protein BerOc1_03554 [Pseudodesulfovibrio hydrargyri]